MMHYRKGENVEQEITKDDLPFDDCWPKNQKNFLWMQVKGGTNVNNVITYAKNALDKGEYRSIVWSGSGGGVVKTVSCAEILKRSYPLYQVTRMCYTTIEEHWKPQMDGLEEIVANRKIPCIHILMSLDAIDESVNGVQKPNTTTDFWLDFNKNTASKQSRGGQLRMGGQNQRQRYSKSNKQQQQQQKKEQQNDQESQQKPPLQQQQKKQRHEQKNQQLEASDKTEQGEQSQHRQKTHGRFTQEQKQRHNKKTQKQKQQQEGSSTSGAASVTEAMDT